MRAPLDFAPFAEALESPSLPAARSFRPAFLRLNPSDVESFWRLCRERSIVLVDSIDRQVLDLAAIRLPAAGASERRRFVENALEGAGGAAAYGTWVHFPWDGKIVHLLDSDDYFDVITNRNQDKLTREEQERLRTKRVGVMGLSVGGEAAVTVAQEHLCGEIRLADFDGLDLSNLNRLGAGCDEIGHNKALIVARRIAKIDPYLDVTVHEEGVTESNLDSFLDGLDLLLEECDGLAMKWEVRNRARERGLDVVFAADERGFLSVEPYAHAPDLGVFHGRIPAPQPPKEAFSTPLAFLKVLTEWMGGFERVSERSRRSLEKVGSILCGYPQLASEARFAAGEVGHVARRLLLGEELPPFIGNVDLDELVPSR
jgi:molybdopterin/thiamine biosynthesis adenylyltransferase